MFQQFQTFRKFNNRIPHYKKHTHTHKFPTPKISDVLSQLFPLKKKPLKIHIILSVMISA